MSTLLEIFGRAITIDTADLIWHWLNAGRHPKDDGKSAQLHNIIDLMGNMKLDAAQQQLKLYLFENPSSTRGRMAAAAICLDSGLTELGGRRCCLTAISGTHRETERATKKLCGRPR